MSRRAIENTKNVVIVLLLLSIFYVLIVQVFELKGYNFKEDEILVEVSNLLYPKRVVYEFDDENYYEDYKVRDEAIVLLQNMMFEVLADESTSLKKIEPKSVDTSVYLDYSFGITLYDIYSIKGYSRSNVEDIPKGKVQFIRAVIEPSKKLIIGIEDDIFIVDTNSSEFVPMFQHVNNIIIENNFNDNKYSFKSIDDLDALRKMDANKFGLKIPVRIDGDLEVFKIKRENELSDLSSINNVVSNIFGASKSFVKKLKTKTGELVYIYNYGEKQLRFFENGTIDYEFISADDVDVDTDFKRSLSVALSFIERVNADSSEFLLLSYLFDEESNEYHFTFYKPSTGFRNLVSNIGVSAVVKNNEVIKFKRNVPKIISSEYVRESEKTTDFDKISKAISKSHFKNMMNLEYARINNIKSDDKEFEDLYGKAISSIDRFYVDYYLSGHNSLRPAYVFKMANTKFIVDYYTGNLVEVIR